MKQLRQLALSALVLLGSAGCGVRKGAPDWIGSEAAVVRCTVSGPNLALPQLFDELPSPTLPTGLYARMMDPIALDELGFERERVVCATLQAPDAAELEHAAASITKLHAQRRELLRSTRKLGGCRCAYADALGVRAMVPGCIDKPTDLGCARESEQVERLAALLRPFEATLAATEVPRTHWRLAGRTDRIGRFVARHEQLIGRHGGGSEVFFNTRSLPPQPGTKLIAGLLAVEHVVAVVRQDGGRGLLVVREIDDELILDHFAYPDWHGAGLDRNTAIELPALLGHIEDTQLARYRAALEPPRQRRELMLDPRKGSLVELDHAALERVDQATLIAASYAQIDYAESREVRKLPPLLVDRVSYQVPFGTEGEAVRARMRLSDDGRRWLSSVTGQSPIEAAATLGIVDVVPEFEPAVAGFSTLFLLRGQAIEQVLFAGISSAPKLLIAVAAAIPSAVHGEVEEFELELPTGPLPGGFPTRKGLAELRERLSLASYTLAVELIDGGRTVAIELEPR